MIGVFAGRPAAVGALVLVLLVVAGCEDDPAGPTPPPLTGTGRLVGSVSFDGFHGAPIPAATLRAEAEADGSVRGHVLSDGLTGAWSIDQLGAGTYRLVVEAVCFGTITIENLEVDSLATVVPSIQLSVGTSPFQRIQLLGSFNGFDLDSAADMRKLAPCVWVDTLDLTEVDVPIEFKFVTNGDFDTTPDYGQPGDQFDPASGPCRRGAAGASGNIRIQLAEPGRYFFEIDERFPRYIVARMGPIPTENGTAPLW
ncbi:MAG TPA: carboxypeptidase-like regulatory domain-containing protein [Candidatus Eisenbacteria bacterium]